jgi:hypothetical protein
LCLSTNNLNILHLIFGPSLAVAQSQNPQRSAAMSAVLFNRRNQIQPKSERNLAQVICGQALWLAPGNLHRQRNDRSFSGLHLHAVDNNQFFIYKS